MYGRRPVAEALRAGVPVDRLLLAPGLRPAPLLDEIRELARAAGASTQEADRSELDRAAAGGVHQGVVAVVQPFRYRTLGELLGGGASLLVLLDGVTDPANLGSILRSAEALGWDAVLVPRHRSVTVTPSVRKVAAGAAERVPVALVGSAAETALRLQREGFRVLGLDPAGPVDYRETAVGAPACLVVGAEGSGLSRLVRERCDELVRVPMRGALGSLNAAVAAAIVMAELGRRRG